MSVCVNIELLSDLAKVPFKPGKSTDGAYDVVATSVSIIHNEQSEIRIVYGLGFKTNIPEGYRCKIAPRSSIRNKSLILANGEGIIDSQYTDEWFVTFVPTVTLRSRDILAIAEGNTSNIEGIYQIGDRIAQIYIEKVEDLNWELCEVSTSNSRGGGHGHTDYLIPDYKTKGEIDDMISDIITKDNK